MMIGRFTHKVDGVGRVSLPSSFRASWPEEIILYLNTEKGVIESCTEKRFQEISNRVTAGSTDFLGKDFSGRDIIINSVKLRMSAEGRIKLPAKFISAIHAKDSVIFVGLNDRFQIHGEKTEIPK